MIKLNARENDVEVVISGNSGDISRELHALLDCIKNNENMQVALITAIAVEAISKEQGLQDNKEISEFFKNVLGKGNKHENLKS